MNQLKDETGTLSRDVLTVGAWPEIYLPPAVIEPTSRLREVAIEMRVPAEVVAKLRGAVEAGAEQKYELDLARVKPAATIGFSAIVRAVKLIDQSADEATVEVILEVTGVDRDGARCRPRRARRARSGSRCAR